MIIIESRGDNDYIETFDNKQDAFTFLYSLVGRMYTYFNSDNDDFGNYCFDIEDDLLLMSDTVTNETWQCAGWHWPGDECPPIVLPCGVNLYELFEQVSQ